MSFVFLDTPDITGQCAMCKHHDCSKQGEKWVHFTTIETDGGYSPAIGMRCLRMLFDNVGIDVREVTHEVVRPPTSDEILTYIKENAIVEVKQRDNRNRNTQRGNRSTTNQDRQNGHSTQEGTK